MTGIFLRTEFMLARIVIGAATPKDIVIEASRLLELDVCSREFIEIISLGTNPSMFVVEPLFVAGCRRLGMEVRAYDDALMLVVWHYLRLIAESEMSGLHGYGKLAGDIDLFKAFHWQQQGRFESAPFAELLEIYDEYDALREEYGEWPGEPTLPLEREIVRIARTALSEFEQHIPQDVRD
jgi:hypothetical protein